jgi:hypothetical protein
MKSAVRAVPDGQCSKSRICAVIDVPAGSVPLCDDSEMKRNPLWLGEVDIVRAIFGHAANADPDRLLRDAPKELTGRVSQVTLEERMKGRRLDVLVTVTGESGNGDQRLVVEAKVGAVVDFDTLAEYSRTVRPQGGLAVGLLVAPYQPVGQLPPGWYLQDLTDVADRLSCPPSGGATACTVCHEISYAISEAAASDRVAEWRALTSASRYAGIPDDWVMKGDGSSVGRPLVYFQSPWLGAAENAYVQVEAGNYYGSPRAAVMLLARAPSEAERVVFPDELWQVLAHGSASAPALTDGVTDASLRGRGAKDEQAAIDAGRNGVPPAWSLGFNMKGWHRRGRILRHPHDDYHALVPVAIHQGLALFNVASQALQG